MIAVVKSNQKFYYTHVFAIIMNGWKSQIIGFDETLTQPIFINIYNETFGKRLNRVVFIIDTEIDSQSWIENKKINGYKWFIAVDNVLKRIKKHKEIEQDILDKLHELQSKTNVNDIHMINSKQDIDNLFAFAFGFHDAYVKKINKNNRGYQILFDTTWGCEIEFTLEGDSNIQIETDHGTQGEILSANMFIENRYVYWVDSSHITSSEEIEPGFAYFRAQNVIWKFILADNQ